MKFVRLRVMGHSDARVIAMHIILLSMVHAPSRDDILVLKSTRWLLDQQIQPFFCFKSPWKEICQIEAIAMPIATKVVCKVHR